MSTEHPISEDTRERIVTPANGISSIAVPFYFQKNGDILLSRRATPSDGWIDLDEGDDYSLAGAGVTAGGTITLTVAANGTAAYRVQGDAALDRLTSVLQGGAVKGTSLDRELDRTRLIQQEQRRDSRANATAILNETALRIAAVAAEAVARLAGDAALGARITSEAARLDGRIDRFDGYHLTPVVGIATSTYVTGGDVATTTAEIQAAINSAAALGVPCYVGSHTVNSLTVPTGSILVFVGTLTGTTNTTILNVTGQRVRLEKPALVSMGIEFATTSADVYVDSPVISGATFGLHFRTNANLTQARANNITVLNAQISAAIGTGGFLNLGAGVLIDGCERVRFIGGWCAADCDNGWRCFGARDLTVEGFELRGRWRAGFLNLAFRSVSGALAFQRCRYIRCKVFDFYDPDNGGTGEGISFDCHGNVAADCSIVLTTTVAAIGAGSLTPTANLPTAYTMVNYAVRFQSGRLRGRRFRVYAAGGDGLGPWQLADNWVDFYTLASEGDVVSLEMDCRDNLIEDCEIMCTASSAITRVNRHAIAIYGMPGVRVVRPVLKGIEVDQAPVAPDIWVQSVRGVIDPTKDFCVTNDVSIEDVHAPASTIIVDSYAYNAFALPWTTGVKIIDCEAKQLTLKRQIGSVQSGNTFSLPTIYDQVWNSADTYIPSTIETNGSRRILAVRGTIQSGVETIVLRVPIAAAEFARSFEIDVGVSWNGFVGVYRAGVITARRSNQAPSVLTVSSVQNAVLSTIESATEPYVDLTDVTITPTITGSTDFNKTDAVVRFAITATCAGTGVGDVSALQFHAVVRDLAIM